MQSFDETRHTLKAQHLRLQSLIAELRATAAGLSTATDGKEVARAALEAVVARFRTALEAHLFDEERLLGPILMRIDAWGPQRLELMQAEHAHQRAVLAVLGSDRTRVLPNEALARRAWDLSADVLADMAAEEREILVSSVLTDDTIALDQSEA